LLILHRFDSRLLAWRAVAGLGWCGTMCYSLYLVHQIPVKAVSAVLYAWGFRSGVATLLVVMPACVAMSLVLGRVFFRTVESRFLNLPLRQSAERRAIREPGFATGLKMTSLV
jgi:peptidoglycan/LPS O-acetylase OafA/YrhL